MYGRYGNDQLNNAILIASVVFGLISVAVSGIADLIFGLLQLIALVLWALRAFSKNPYNRRRENDNFLRIWYKAKNRFSGVSGFFKRLGDRQHKYFKCPNCKSRLRVPRGRGNITVTCPRCRNKFDKKS